MELFPEGWHRAFAFQTPLLELIARGGVLYLALLFLMRIMPRRAGGQFANLDMVYVVLIANAAARSLGEYASVSDGVAMVATLMGWNFILNSLSYRFRWVEKLISPPAVQIVRNGELLKRAMRREFLTLEELQEHLREQGVERMSDVKAAFIEGDGHISIIRQEKD